VGGRVEDDSKDKLEMGRKGGAVVKGSRRRAPGVVVGLRSILPEIPHSF